MSWRFFVELTRARGTVPPLFALAVPFLLASPALALLQADASVYWKGHHPGAGGSGGGRAALEPCASAGPWPSAVDIPTPGPAGTLGYGGALTATVEYEPTHFTVADLGRTVIFPSLLAVFPLATGSEQEIFFAHANATIAAPGWSAPETERKVEGGGTTFARSVPAYLSTSRIAVMVIGPNAGLQIAVRWHWSTESPGGATENGSWTVPVPTPRDDTPPSILYPAPYVGVLRTSGSYLHAGANWTGTFDGEIDAQTFRISFEWAGNGTELRSEAVAVGPRLIEFNASLPFVGAGGGSVPPGAYLVHLHNGCDAILHSLTVDVTASANDAIPPPVELVSGGRSSIGPAHHV